MKNLLKIICLCLLLSFSAVQATQPTAVTLPAPGNYTNFTQHTGTANYNGSGLQNLLNIASTNFLEQPWGFFSALPFIYAPSGFMANNGTLVIGQAPSATATATFSATSGTGVTMTLSSADLLGTAADVGRVLTILDTTYKYATITAQSTTSVATVTLTGTLSGVGPFANSVIWLTGSTTTNTTAYSVAFLTTYTNGFMYMPAGAISSGSAAGLYAVQCASTTVCTLYNNTYSSGQPEIPGSLTAFSTTGPGVYAQTTASPISLISVSIPANAMGINGKLEMNYVWDSDTSSNSKHVGWNFGAYGIFDDIQTTAGYRSVRNALRNTGVATSQITLNGIEPGTGTGIVRPAVTTSSANSVVIYVYSATATDPVTIEGFDVTVWPQS